MELGVSPGCSAKIDLPAEMKKQLLETKEEVRLLLYNGCQGAKPDGTGWPGTGTQRWGKRGRETGNDFLERPRALSTLSFSNALSVTCPPQGSARASEFSVDPSLFTGGRIDCSPDWHE